jgi:hypothetical protein
MNKLYALGRRSVFASVSLLLGLSVTLPALLSSGVAYASGSGGQITNRSIKMSSTVEGATNVTYALTFTPVTSETNPDVIVDFCDNSPLISDTCTATAGTDTPNFSTGPAAATGWTVTTIGSGRGIKLTTSSVSFTSGTPVTITITNVVNPTNTGAAGGFYGRIITYANGTAGTNTSASPGSYVDYGGVALSTVNSVNITAKVFETLTFCVYTGASCAAGSAPTLTLGDSVTGALSTQNAYINSDAKYDLATNAAGNNGSSQSLAVVMKGTTLCRTTGVACNTGSADANTITPMTTTPAILSTGSEQFGMCVDKNSSTALSVAAAYTDSVNNCHSLATGVYSGTSKFGFDNTNVTSASGSTIITSAGAVPSVTGSFTFLADVAATTEAGIYQTSLNMVATSTF